MLILRSSPPSPFGRKVKIAAALAGLSDRISIETADTMDPSEALRTQNPLGKIPTLSMLPSLSTFSSAIAISSSSSRVCGAPVAPTSSNMEG